MGCTQRLAPLGFVCSPNKDGCGATAGTTFRWVITRLASLRGGCIVPTGAWSSRNGPKYVDGKEPKIREKGKAELKHETKGEAPAVPPHPFSIVVVATWGITWTESLYLGQKNGSTRYDRLPCPWVHGQALSDD